MNYFFLALKLQERRYNTTGKEDRNVSKRKRRGNTRTADIGERERKEEREREKKKKHVLITGSYIGRKGGE